MSGPNLSDAAIFINRGKAKDFHETIEAHNLTFASIHFGEDLKFFNIALATYDKGIKDLIPFSNNPQLITKDTKDAVFSHLLKMHMAAEEMVKIMRELEKKAQQLM